MYRDAISPRKGLNFPNEKPFGSKCLRPTVKRATIGIKYEKFVAIVAVAVMAENATVLPMTAHVIATLSTNTNNAACTGMRFLLRVLKYLENGKTPSREIANVTR